MLASTNFVAILLIMVSISIIASKSTLRRPITEFDPNCGLLDFEPVTLLKPSQ